MSLFLGQIWAPAALAVSARGAEITLTLPGSQGWAVLSSQDSLEVAASAGASQHGTEMGLGAQTALELSRDTLNSTS